MNYKPIGVSSREVMRQYKLLELHNGSKKAANVIVEDLGVSLDVAVKLLGGTLFLKGNTTKGFRISNDDSTHD